MDEADLWLRGGGITGDINEDLGSSGSDVPQCDHLPQLVIRGQLDWDGLGGDDVVLHVLPGVVHLTHQAVVSTRAAHCWPTQVQLERSLLLSWLGLGCEEGLAGPGREVDPQVGAGDVEDAGAGLHGLLLGGETTQAGEPVDLTGALVHSTHVGDPLTSTRTLFVLKF